MCGVDCSPHSIPELLEEIRALLRDVSLRPRSIMCLNAHISNLARSDPSLKRHLNAARVVAADGMPIIWVGRLKGHRVDSRCNMTEAFRAFLRDETLPSSSALLIGCTEKVAGRAAAAMNQESHHCRVVQVVSGYEPIDAYVRAIGDGGPFDFILVGMGSPRSEAVLSELSGVAPESMLWHIGGGTIGFYAGGVKEAPLWMRRSGLQWLHRLGVEPKRMWRRYLLGNCAFLFGATLDVLRDRLRALRSENGGGDL